MGADMHTASLFPESPALKENNALAVANHTRDRGWRLTMTLPLLCAAESTIIMAFGDGKSGAVAQALTLPADPLLRPVQGIQPVNGSLLWIIDSAAASKL